MDIKSSTSLRDNTCRTCMKQFHEIQKDERNKIHSIYEVPAGCQSNTSLMEILQLLEPSIKITINDNLPKILCSKCIEKILNAYEFIEAYKEADKKFRAILKELDNAHSNDCMKEEDQSVDALDDVDDEIDTHEITKVEFEIEEVKNDITEEILVENENEMDCPEVVDEPLSEISDVYNKKVSRFINSYNYNNNAKSNTLDICQKNRRRRKMDRVIDFYENKKDHKIGLPPQNEDGSISCRECDAVLENLTIWQQHMRQHRLGKIKTSKTSKPSKMGYECEYCNKAFKRNAAYENHIRTHTGEEPYLCIECGKTFKVVSGLNTHMLRHKGEKTYQCPKCPKKFVCSSGLYGHMMVHSKEKPYVCDICGSAFHMAYQLRNHNLYHSGTKKFQCEYCDMRFVTSEKQRRHMRTHTGEKPYRCKYCERAFAQSNDCIKHLRQHLGDNVYQCELCPLRFPMARDMKAHFATHKDDDEETKARNLQARLEEERNLRIKLGVQES